MAKKQVPWSARWPSDVAKKIHPMVSGPFHIFSRIPGNATLPTIASQFSKVQPVPNAKGITNGMPEISFAKALMVAEKHCRLGVRPDGPKVWKPKWNMFVDFFSWTYGEIQYQREGGFTTQKSMIHQPVIACF